METISRRWTLEEYLDYDDGTVTRYELVAGELGAMPSDSDLNNLIAVTLLLAIAQFVSPKLLRRGTEMVISGLRATTRIPDLLVLTEELASKLQGATRSMILLDMPPPAVAIEKISIATIVTSDRNMPRAASRNTGLSIPGKGKSSC